MWRNGASTRSRQAPARGAIYWPTVGNPRIDQAAVGCPWNRIPPAFPAIIRSPRTPPHRGANGRGILSTQPGTSSGTNWCRAPAGRRSAARLAEVTVPVVSRILARPAKALDDRQHGHRLAHAGGMHPDEPTFGPGLSGDAETLIKPLGDFLAAVGTAREASAADPGARASRPRDTGARS